MICAVVLWLISDSRRTGAIWHPQMWACSLRFLAEKNWPAGAVMLVWVTTCQCWSPKFGSTAASMRTVWQWEVHSTSALLEPLRARIKQDIGMQLWRVRAWMQLGNIHYKHETYGFPNMEDERQKNIQCHGLFNSIFLRKPMLEPMFSPMHSISLAAFPDPVPLLETLVWFWWSQQDSASNISMARCNYLRVLVVAKTPQRSKAVKGNMFLLT